MIVATQMMESMITNSRPTRAEASDVANAILDGADAVMLSAESSVGAYPIETVKTMAKIVVAAEEELLSKGLQPLVPGKKPRTQGGSVARAACEIADFLDGKALVAFTQSGDTARRLSRYRTAQPILAFTTDEATRNQLALSWGVESHVVPHADNTDAMVDLVDAELLKLNRYNNGDTMVITHAARPPASPAPPTWSGCTTWAAASGTDRAPHRRAVGRTPGEEYGPRRCAAPGRVRGAGGCQPLPPSRKFRSPGTVSVPPNWPTWTTLTLVKKAKGTFSGGGV